MESVRASQRREVNNALDSREYIFSESHLSGGVEAGASFYLFRRLDEFRGKVSS